MSGLVSGVALDRHDGARARRSRARCRGRDRGRDEGHDLRHGDRHAAARWRASRSPPTAARPGTRPPARRRGPTPGSRTARRARTIRARAVDDSRQPRVRARRASRVDVGCPCTMFGPNVTPSILDQGDLTPVERGRALQVRPRRHHHRRPLLQGGRRTPAPTSATSGRRTARCSRAGRSRVRSATGWQQLTFSTPVDITAGTTYVASYYAPRGHYSTLVGVLLPARARRAGTRRDTSPLHALSANSGGANGVYTYAGDTTFPTSTYNGENYAVDVVFTPKLPPGPVSGVTRHGRRRLGDRQLHGAGRGRAADALRRHPVHRLDRAARDHGHGQPAGDVGQGHRPHARHGVHVQGAGGQRQRDQCDCRRRRTRSRRPRRPSRRHRPG